MKIFIIGLPGSGKTTYARQLAIEQHIPLLELDSLFVEPISGRGRRRFLEEIQSDLGVWIDRDSWIIEGVYPIESIMERADRIVLIESPLWRCLVRIWQRTLSESERRKTYGWRSEIALTCSLFAWWSRVYGVKVYRNKPRIMVPRRSDLVRTFGESVVAADQSKMFD